MASGESDPLGQIRDWLDRFYRFAIDADHRRQRWLDSRTTDRRSELSDDWKSEHEAFDEQARVLELECEDRILPFAKALRPDLASSLSKAKIALEELRFDIYDVLSEANLGEKYSDQNRRAARLMAELAGHLVPEVQCPACNARFTDAISLSAHFNLQHYFAPQERGDLILDPATHEYQIHKSVEPCRTAYRECMYLLASGEASGTETSRAEPERAVTATAGAESRCLTWLKQQVASGVLLKREEAFQQARALIGPELSERAFRRAWKRSAPPKWKRGGRRRDSTTK